MPVNRSIAYAIEYIYCTCNTYGLSIHILCCGGQFAPFFGRFSAVFLHFSVLLKCVLFEKSPKNLNFLTFLSGGKFKLQKNERTYKIFDDLSNKTHFRRKNLKKKN